jgi:hypothetical protein
MGQARSVTDRERWDDDPEWERLCLEATRRLLHGYDEWRGFNSIRSVELQGERPTTEIVVTYRARGATRDIAEGFRLWDELMEDSLGNREGPEVVATQIYANVTEDLP